MSTETKKVNVPELYGSLVFNDAEMRARLPQDVYQSLKKTIDEGSPLQLDVANSVAVAMKEWAIEHGATHFTHWFQPMTGVTAEKHDSFLTPTEGGEALMEFSGKELVKGEPDASSFPSGGLRATFEARGYTAWDPTSYAFIKGHTLCIPTAFCSYNGEALDKKTPLLRSMDAIDKEATRLLHIIGRDDVKRVHTTVGAEQEYFLIDRDMFYSRRDLIFCGRTLIGAPAPKGQEMEDQYFASIRLRVEDFMADLNEELWKLGIPAKTEHNEVAPAQHELAPIFENVNTAVDHNQLIMETMKKVASRHNLYCLLHEKPFDGINGNGKHTNWALMTDSGENLLKPGKKPAENLQFLLFLAAVIEAVDVHADMLRLSVANAGNDHRLGANEAPPAIISIFLGDEIEAIVQSIVNGEAFSANETVEMDMGSKVLPNVTKDNTDRNRTSPFAFSNNKFEFRMPGASMSLSGPNFVLNTAVAEALGRFSDELENVPKDELDGAIKKLLKDSLTEHQRVIFNGNGYSDEWIEEAERRGLPNLKSTPEALPCYLSDKNKKMFFEQGIFTEDELVSRYEIKLESYVKTEHIEAKTMAEMVQKDLLPTVMTYASDVAASALNKKSLLPNINAKAEEELVEKLSDLANAISSELDTLKEMTATVEGIEDNLEAANYYHDTLLPQMDKLRAVSDEAEALVPDEMLPYPTYGALLFYS